MRTLLFAALLALPAAAQEITAIDAIPLAGGTFADPADIRKVSVGAQLVIDGSGFAGLTGVAKPKVFINSGASPKPRALKVLAFSDTQITAEIRKGVPGDFDLTVQPKGKDLAPLVATDVVRVVPPVFEQPNPPAASPGDLVTLSGFAGVEAFGTKPGKVRVGGKPAVIASWLPGEIIFEMPAKLANGLYQVEVANKIAKATVEEGVPGAPFALEMVDSSFDLGGPDRFSCKLGTKKYVAPPNFLFGPVIAQVGSDPVPNVTMNTTDSTTGQPRFELVVPVDLETAVFPLLVFGSADGKVEVGVCTDFEFLFCAQGAQTTWTTDHDQPGADDYVMVLHSYDFNAETGGNQLVGTFAASALRIEGTKKPPTYEITVGDFRVTPLSSAP